MIRHFLEIATRAQYSIFVSDCPKQIYESCRVFRVIVCTLKRKEMIETASIFAEKGFLCSEAVLMAISKSLSMESPLIPRIATGFGAGIARGGEVCGALSGGIIGLGLKYGRQKPSRDERKRPYWYANILVKRFRDKLGNTSCPGLLNLDLAKQVDYEKYQVEKMWENQCREYIKSAAGIAFDILEENKMNNYSVGA